MQMGTPEYIYEVIVDVVRGDWETLLLDYRSLETALNSKYFRGQYAESTNPRQQCTVYSFASKTQFIGMIGLTLFEMVDANKQHVSKVSISYKDSNNISNPVKKVHVGDL